MQYLQWLENGILILLFGAGVYLSTGCGFFQLTHFRHILQSTLGAALRPARGRPKDGFTPFQALTTALASSVGTGNIAGVAGAIALGGPGAVFWMWVGAFFGMATKFTEVVLAVRYRKRSPKGGFEGGPMYYICAGLPRGLHWLAWLFALCGMAAACGVGNMTQVNTVAVTMVDAVNTLSGQAMGPNQELRLRLLIGIALALITGVVILGGLTRIGSVTEKVVPFMSVAFVLAAVIVLIWNWESILPALNSILAGAFVGFRPAFGGAIGFSVGQAMRMGMLRGVFSNEAGLGSAPMAHASAQTKHPVQQGMYGVIEVWIDTIVMCTLTALVILASGIEIPYGDPAAGSLLMIRALATLFGQSFAGVFIAGAILLFAFSTLVGWSLYGVRCASFLFGAWIETPYRVAFCLLAVVGATADVGAIWKTADLLNALMTVPNLLAILALSGTVFALLRQYRRRL